MLNADYHIEFDLPQRLSAIGKNYRLVLSSKIDNDSRPLQASRHPRPSNPELTPLKIIHFDKGDRYEPEKDWKRISLCTEEDISVEHFVKPPRHASPKHDHENAQVLIVLEGMITIVTDDEAEELGVGDTAYIPGGVPHVVTNTLDTPSTGIDIFVPGRSFDFWLKRKKR